VERLAHFKREALSLRSKDTALRHVATGAIRELIASSSASADVPTRKAIFSAHFDKELGSWAGATGVYIRGATTDAFDGFLIILTFPFQDCGQNIVERSSGVLSMPLSIVFELGLALRFEVCQRPSTGLHPSCVCYSAIQPCAR
jgi:hypothetical protein